MVFHHLLSIYIESRKNKTLEFMRLIASKRTKTTTKPTTKPTTVK